MFLKFQLLRGLPEGLVSVSPPLTLWSTVRADIIWMLESHWEKRGAGMGDTRWWLAVSMVHRRCTTWGFSLRREREEWSVHPVSQLWGELVKELVSNSPDLGTDREPHILNAWCSLLRTRESGSACYSLEVLNLQFWRQTTEKTRDYELL